MSLTVLLDSIGSLVAQLDTSSVNLKDTQHTTNI